MKPRRERGEGEEEMEEQKEKNRRWKRFVSSTSSSSSSSSSSSTRNTINTLLDDGCLMHIFSFLPPIPEMDGLQQMRDYYQGITSSSEYNLVRAHPAVCWDHSGGRLCMVVSMADRYNTALVCHRWCYLACHPRLWVRVERSIKPVSDPRIFPDIEAAVSAARPGDTILIAAGGNHLACNIQIKKPLCLIGGGDLPDETVLICSRGSDSALEFLSTCKIANLTVRAELGCCLLHRSGRLTIEGCILQCEENPLDYLSYPIVSTASTSDTSSSAIMGNGDSVSVSHTQIEGGAKAVVTRGTLALQRVRVIYSRTALFFWFDVDHR